MEGGFAGKCSRCARAHEAESAEAIVAACAGVSIDVELIRWPGNATNVPLAVVDASLKCEKGSYALSYGLYSLWPI